MNKTYHDMTEKDFLEMDAFVDQLKEFPVPINPSNRMVEVTFSDWGIPLANLHVVVSQGFEKGDTLCNLELDVNLTIPEIDNLIAQLNLAKEYVSQFDNF